MGDYSGRIEVNRSAAEVFAFLADIRNMPRYLPTVQQAGPQGPDHVEIEGESDGHHYHSTGSFRADPEARRLSWDSDSRLDYRGELRVHDTGSGDRCEVELRLHLAPESEGLKRIEEKGASPEEVMRQALDRTLAGIRSACEAGTGAGGGTTAGADKDTTRSADDLPDSRMFGSSATMNPDI